MLDDWNPKTPKSPATPFSSVSTPPTSQSDEALVKVGPINRIPGTDSISCPGLPSGMMCLGWGEQGWAITDKDGKRIAAGNWGECATLPASQSEALVVELERTIATHWQSAKDAARAILPIIAAREAAARAEGRREGIEEAAKVADASPFNNGLNDAPASVASAIRARLEEQTND